jgi:broad specificity phosphatase PhoE
MTTRLILIRHGSTDWHQEKRYCGTTDLSLNNQGKKEARKLYQRLKKENISRVYSSDARRARQFAEIVFKRFSVKTMPELRELDFGAFEGLTYEEITEKFPRIYARWLKNPIKSTIPHGESFSSLKRRVSGIFKKILFLNRNKTLALVTHAGPIKIIFNEILKTKNIWAVTPDLASLSIIDFKNGRGKILVYNETSYLNG